jgi:hypothetical protein
VTPRGIRTVRLGMTTAEVQEALGTAIQHQREGALECVRYGMPTLKSPSFAVTQICSEEGRVVRFKEERFEASQVETPKH